MEYRGALRWIVGILCVALAGLLAFLMIRYQQGEREHEAPDHCGELGALHTIELTVEEAVFT